MPCVCPAPRGCAMTLLLWVLTGAGCTSSQPPVPPDLPPRSPADLGAPDAAPPDPGPRAPWHAISPTPGDSDLQDVDGASLADYYVISAGAVIHRAAGQDTVEWQGAACLHGLRVAGG